MRALLAAIAATFLASCASTPTGDTVTRYDHKYNQAYVVKQQADSEFVGTGAKAGDPAKAKPSWYVRGHP